MVENGNRTTSLLVICPQCGHVSQGPVQRCPECYGSVIDYHTPASVCPTPDLDSRAYYRAHEGELQTWIKRTKKRLEQGISVLAYGNTESAVNNFRAVMEGIISCRLLMSAMGSYEQGSWLVKTRQLNKAPEEVELKSADQALFLKESGLIDDRSFEAFEIVRKTGNKGSHIGSGVTREEAARAETYAKKLYAELTADLDQLATLRNPPFWINALNSRRNVLVARSADINAKIPFLQSKNAKSQDFIIRCENRRDYDLNHFQREEAAQEQAKADSAEQEIVARNDECASLVTEQALITAEIERLLSVINPKQYADIMTKRAEYKRKVDEQEEAKALAEKSREKVRKIASVVFGVAVVLGLIILIVASTM